MAVKLLPAHLSRRNDLAAGGSSLFREFLDSFGNENRMALNVGLTMILETIANLPIWTIYAAVGACLGAFGALLGWTVGGTGQGWSRVLPVVAVACSVPLTRTLVLPNIQRAVVDSQTQSIPWLSALRDEFPDEYKKLLANLEGTSSLVAARQIGFDFMVDFRRRHATDMANAVDQDLVSFLQDYISLIVAVRDKHGHELCGAFVMKGAPALGENQNGMIDELGRNVSALIRTIASGLRNPQTVDPVTESDWAAVAARFLEAGGTDEELQLLGDLQSSSPSYCNASLGFFRAVIDTPAPTGHRIRAMMAKEMAGS